MKLSIENYSREDLAWLAGFFEGEGSFRQSDRAYWEITQSSLEPLERGFSIFPVGKIYGPYANKPGRQPYYRWVACKFEEVQAVVAATWPWLSRRRRDQYKSQLSKVQNKFKNSKYYAKHGRVIGA